MRDAEAELWIRRAMRAVNGLETVCDSAWTEFDGVLDSHTRAANRKLRGLIANLPGHSDPGLRSKGYIDFATPAGTRQRARFFKDAKKIYDAWHDGIASDMDIQHFDWKADPWDKSLGLSYHRGGKWLMLLRDEIVRKSNELASLLDHFKECLEFVAPIFEATKPVKSTGGVLSARITGRGLPAHHKTHSRTTSIILRGLKGVIRDQEKSMLENVFRGMDQLPRDHANKLYDSSTGLTLRDALNAVADDFSTGQMNKRQLKLSVQTHIRAMMRRVAGESEQFKAITGVKSYLKIPATMKKDLMRITPREAKEAFTIVKFKDQLYATKGSADSLGAWPGDKSQLIPIPPGSEERIANAAQAMRRSYLKRTKQRGRR